MKRSVNTGLIVLAVVAVLLVAGYFVYKHFILDQVIDEGGMENPAIQFGNRPSDGAELVYCSLTHGGELAEENYSYTLEKTGTSVFLSADYVMEDGTHQVIDEQNIDPQILSELNALVLSFDLTEATPRPSDSDLMDAFGGSYTLRWDDGTVSNPAGGFQRVQEYFEDKVLSQIRSGSNKDRIALSEIQVIIPTLPTVGEAPELNTRISQGLAVVEVYWWQEDEEEGKMNPTSDVFETEGNYSMRIILRPEEGYWIPVIATGDSDTPLVYQGTLTINDEPMMIVPAHEDGTLILDWWNKPALKGE